MVSWYSQEQVESKAAIMTSATPWEFRSRNPETVNNRNPLLVNSENQPWIGPGVEPTPGLSGLVAAAAAEGVVGGGGNGIGLVSGLGGGGV